MSMSAEVHCPRCGARHDQATSIKDIDPNKLSNPAPGDLSLCILCGAIGVFALDAFDNRLVLRHPERGDLEKISEADAAKLFLAQAFIRSRGRPA